MLLNVPPNITAPVKLFAAVLKSMLLLAIVEAKVIVPALSACVIAPISLIAPADVMDNAPVPRFDAANVMGALLTNVTSLLPLLLSDTAPVNVLPVFVKLIAPVPPLIVAV